MMCEQHYPDLVSVPYPYFEAIFTAIADRDVDLAMIPIDNSLAGRIADIHHLLPLSNLYIIAEHFMRIRFSLLGLPGSRLDEIKTVHSHAHALEQCRGTIRQYGFVPITSGDTAGAAREVCEAGDPTRAAISPPLAAVLYGLDVLASDIEDADHNTTRFVVLSREFVRALEGAGPVVTSIVFKAKNIPASLYKALGGFATNAVNITKLESYMVDGEFTVTMFLADVEGHPDQPGLRRALEELSFFAADVKVLGVYPANPFRTDHIVRPQG